MLIALAVVVSTVTAAFAVDGIGNTDQADTEDPDKTRP
jgi:hypothetical protein